MNTPQYQILTGVELIAAIDWIAECQWPDLDESDIEDLTNEEITRAIKKYYSGGIAQFRIDHLTVS